MSQQSPQSRRETLAVLAILILFLFLWLNRSDDQGLKPKRHQEL